MAEATSQLTPNSVVVPSAGVHSAEVEGNAILVDVLHDRSYRLNDDGTKVWTALDGAADVGQIAKGVARESGMAEEECYEITAEYLRDMLDRGLVSLAHGDAWRVKEKGT